MAALFGAAFLYGIVALAVGLHNFWRGIDSPDGMLASPWSLWQVVKDAGQLRYLGGGGPGCINDGEEESDRRKALPPRHLLRFPALLCGDLRRHGPSLPAPPRGALSVVGSAGAIAAAAPDAGDESAPSAASRRGVRAVHHPALQQICSRTLPLHRPGPIRAGAPGLHQFLARWRDPIVHFFEWKRGKPRYIVE